MTTQDQAQDPRMGEETIEGLQLFEALAGSRFTVNYMRVGGVLQDFPPGWLRECEAWLDGLEKNMPN